MLERDGHEPWVVGRRFEAFVELRLALKQVEHAAKEMICNPCLVYTHAISLVALKQVEHPTKEIICNRCLSTLTPSLWLR